MDLTGVSVNASTIQTQFAILDSSSITSVGNEFEETLNANYQFSYLTFANDYTGKRSPYRMNLQVFADEGGIYTNLDDGLNFSNRALEHMRESGRQVPMQTLQDAIRYGEAMPDPRGSSATMYYTTMYKNGKMYNLEVLYDEVTNTVYHFEYARKAMGNLPAISK